MDIMTLLLTLFVLLFVYTRAVAPEPAVTAGAVGSGQPAEARFAAAPARLLLEAETRVDLPPQWLGSLVEPPIPELVVRFSGAADEEVVTAPVVAPAETSAVAGVAAVVAPAESVEAAPKDPASSHGAQDRPDDPARQMVAASADQAAQGSQETVSVRAVPAEQQIGQTVPAESVEQPLLAAVEAGELGRRVEVSRRQDAVNLEISDEILFDRGSAALKPGGEALLAELAKLLSQQTMTISVEGHTDNSPIRNARFASNWELSAARATNVTLQLLAHAIDPARVRAIGHADTKPRADNATAEGRARNRRVSLVLHVPAGRQAAR
jgi:chemotaxis protein MotB